jgi:flagellar hook-basal body complex protein FliE
MSNAHIDAVVAQMRTLTSQIHGPLHSAPTASVGAAQPGSFAALLQQGIQQVNSTQLRAGELATAFERGVPGVELPDVMLEMQKANVSFRALTEVRNRFVSAYQEIMNMPI